MWTASFGGGNFGYVFWGFNFSFHCGAHIGPMFGGKLFTFGPRHLTFISGAHFCSSFFGMLKIASTGSEIVPIREQGVLFFYVENFGGVQFFDRRTGLKNKVVKVFVTMFLNCRIDVCLRSETVGAASFMSPPAVIEGM